MLGLSPGLNFLDIAPDSPSTGLRALWAELSAQTSPLPGDETYTEHNGLISIKREIQLADYLTDFPSLRIVSRTQLGRLTVSLELPSTIPPSTREELTRRFRAYFPIPVPEGLAMEISMTPDASGQLLSAHFLTLDSSLLTLQADCVSTGEGVLFAPLCRRLHGQGSGRQRNSRRLGIYRLSPAATWRPSTPSPTEAGPWPSGRMGTVPSFFSPRRRARFFSPCWMQPRSPLLPPRSSFPRRRARPTHRCSHSLTALSASLSAGDFLAVLNRRSGAWVVDFTADTSLQSSLGCPLSTPSSRLSLCYDGTRLAITGPCPSTKSEYFLAVYTADGLEYLGATPPACTATTPGLLPLGLLAGRKLPLHRAGALPPRHGNCLLTNSLSPAKISAITSQTGNDGKKARPVPLREPVVGANRRGEARGY